MEPGHEDREYSARTASTPPSRKPQWSPVMKTGNTEIATAQPDTDDAASMEPGHEDREYGQGDLPGRRPRRASMEPGHEDREYGGVESETPQGERPQWSPVMKTGNT